MQALSFRWQRFRCFEDTGWVEIKPITILIGPNASGKTSLLAPLLLLKQTDDARDASLSLKTKGNLFNAGAFSDLAFEHESTGSVTLEVKFAGPSALRRKGKVRKLGDDPPATVCLEYIRDKLQDSPTLKAFSLKDINDRQMLRRERQPSGDYSISGVNLPEDSDGWTKAIRATKPVGFMFSGESVFSRFYATQSRTKETTGKKPSKMRSFSIGKAAQHYLSMAVYSSESVADVCRSTYYVGPLRDRPRRFYELTGEHPFSVGPGGTYAPEILYRSQLPGFKKEVNRWISAFDFGTGLQIKRLAEGVFSVFLKRKPGTPNINLADTGFGLSQVLPLIVQGFYARKNSLLLAEQPEIHLNPRLQSRLADLFAAIAKRGVSVFLETHSEHFVLRIRRLLAEKKLKSEDVALYFCERINGRSTIRRIDIQQDGGISPSDWPKGFFEDALAESLALAQAQYRGPANAT